jgi:hypothetical protein
MSMIICPNCQHRELAGALFCSECGVQLIDAEINSTSSIYRSQSDPLSPSAQSGNGQGDTSSSGAPEASVTLHLIDQGQFLPLSGRTESTLGRVAEGQPILPDIDLSPFEAYAQGVSRLHAAVKIVNQRIMIVDLGSSNGTRVNGQKITSNVDFPLNHGDLIALGKLKMQILVRY